MNDHPFEDALLTLEPGLDAKNQLVCAGFAFFVGGFTRSLFAGSDAIRTLEDPDYFPALDRPRQLVIEEAA